VAVLQDAAERVADEARAASSGWGAFAEDDHDSGESDESETSSDEEENPSYAEYDDPDGVGMSPNEDEGESDDSDDSDDSDEDSDEDEAEGALYEYSPASAEAQYGTGADQARFSFALMDSVGEPSNLTLRLSAADVSSLHALVTRTGLCAMPVTAVCGPLLESARDGLLDKRAFDGVVRQLIPSTSLTLEERSSFSVLLSAVFYNFEAMLDGESGEYNDTANALELAIGMSLLCRGDKSSKLNYAWQVIDLDEDGLLNRAELLFFLRAFVRMLLALSFEASELGPIEVRRYATDMASWLSGTIIARYADSGTGLVSFDAFAKWYHDGFHQVAPWLELLDLSKWVLV